MKQEKTKIKNGHYLAVAGSISATGKDWRDAVKEVRLFAETISARCVIWFIPTDSRDYRINKIDGTPEIDGRQELASFRFGGIHCLDDAMNRAAAAMEAK